MLGVFEEDVKRVSEEVLAVHSEFNLSLRDKCLATSKQLSKHQAPLLCDGHDT